MLTVVAMLLSALLTPTVSRDLVERGPSLPRNSFCAELEVPEVVGVSLDEEEDLMPLDEEMGCAESDVLQPYDIETPIDAI
jgi:hypothetical protein